MNVKKLAEQAGFDKHHAEYDIRVERFAEIVRQDLYQVIGKSVIEQINSAVQMEREACAQVCLVMASKTEDIRRAALEVAAENILARGDQ